MEFAILSFEVQRFESNAAISQGLDIPGDLSQSFIQYVANNVDHNLPKLDGNNTFRGMGIICGITLCTMQQRPIRREVGSAKKIKFIANVEIEFYKQSNNSAMTITFEDLKIMKNIDKSSCLNFLSLVIWPLKKSYTGVVGEMQVKQIGQYPGKSSGFLPMIDMNPSDLHVSSVYSTLLFVCRDARYYQRAHVMTFDQPLFWKAMTIFWNEPDSSQIRLGAFYTEMSFLSCIGHI